MIPFKQISRFLILTLLFVYSCSSKTDNAKSTDGVSSVNNVHKDTALNGLYSGLEYTGIVTDPVYPGKDFKTFHLGYLKIKGDSVFLDQNPIFVYKNDTSYSASDGGFYYYSGTFQKSDTTISFYLKELFCDYCPIRIVTDTTQEVIKRTKQFKGRLTSKGFIINGYLYAKTAKKEDLISEHPEPYLKSQ
jgi:hypothetical protein